MIKKITKKLQYKGYMISSKIYSLVYNGKLRRNLENHEFTILSSNCMGGIIYHRMGERFCSPTINLWISEPDFQKFCLDLSYYKGCRLVFLETDRNYPVASLGEGDKKIIVNFLHYADRDEAEIKWYERLERMNENNLFVIATDNDGMTKEKLQEWSKMKCRNIVVFTAQDYPEYPYTFWLEKYSGRENVGKCINDLNRITGVRYVESVFNFSNFLNQ